MSFTATVYFDVVSQDVFRFAELLARARAEGVDVDVDWRGFTGAESADRTALAAAELVRVDHRDRHGAFVEALLVAVHLEGVEPGDGSLIPVAARVAGIPTADVSSMRVLAEGMPLLRESVAQAAELGVRSVPSIYTHGPVVAVVSTPALREGPAGDRLEIIAAVAGDDGLWSLTKP